ncbi:hypothetical protein ABPG72_011716 [Tetrahymena utriculariae]
MNHHCRKDQKQRDFIKNEEVDFRNSQLKSVDNYEVSLNLLKGTDYSGTVVIDFKFKQLLQQGQHLQIDYDGQEVNFVELVDQQRQQIRQVDYVFQDQRILISSDQFSGVTVDSVVSIKLKFKNQYYNLDEGLNSTITDQNNQYIYTQGEVANTYKIFPCIEQVNFRATFDLTVTHPASWKVISNEPILSQLNISFDTQKTVFKKSQIALPNYLFTLCAGDYEQYKNIYNDKIGMDTYYRKEKAQYVATQIQDFNDITKFGINFMEQYTKVNYYMDKYDSVYCIDYIYFGMENPGCTTLEERRYVFEQEREPIKIALRSDIIFHEISHMWFGDCISLDWWNNLFLKEGFANFFGYKINKEYFKGKELEWYFEMGKVKVVYGENDPETIFPLSHERGLYQDYQSMEYHNDISYEKGGSVFQMMEQKIYGEQDFQNRMISYFKNNQFTVAGIKQLLAELKEDDSISRKYIFNKGISYYDQGLFKDTYNLGLTSEEYKQLKLKFFAICKQRGKIIEVPHSELDQYSSDKLIIILNNCDGHLVFQRIYKEDLSAISQLNIIEQFNLQLRISLWKAIIFELIQFQKSEDHINFFLDNIRYEQNPVVYHFALRFVPKYFNKWTIEQENKIISVYENEKDKLRNRIVLKNLIRYLFTQENLNYLVTEYLKQTFKIKQKYLDQLTERLDPKSEDYKKLIEKNK